MSNNIVHNSQSLGPLQLIGGGGHALVVAEAAQLAGWLVVGFFDDKPSSALCNVCHYLGTVADALRAEDHVRRIIAVGDLQLRAWIQQRCHAPLANVVHPTAIVSPSAIIGEGSYVAAGVIVNGFADVGAHAILNTRAVVEHDCSLGSNVHIGPGAILGGGVRVGSNTLIGINASVNPNSNIGNSCVVGSGAVVVRSVADDTTVAGVPARRLSKSTLPSHLLTQRRIAS